MDVYGSGIQTAAMIIGGRAFTASELSNLIELRSRAAGASVNFSPMFKRGQSTAYQVPNGQTLTIKAYRVQLLSASSGAGINIAQATAAPSLYDTAAPAGITYWDGSSTRILGWLDYQNGGQNTDYKHEGCLNFTIAQNLYPVLNGDAGTDFLFQCWGSLS